MRWPGSSAGGGRARGAANIARLAWVLALAAIGSLLVGSFAYFQGLWPQRLICLVAGPAGSRLVSVGDDRCDHALPYEVRHVVSWVKRGDEVLCPLELAHGAERLCGRVRMYTCGGYLTGHQALVRGAESRDGSLWQWSGAQDVTVLAPVDGHSWFGYRQWMKSALTVDGVEQPVAEQGAISLRAEHTGPHRIATSGWSMEIEGDAGSVVQLLEWGSPGDQLTLFTDDSGFASGSVALDGGDAQPLALDRAQQPWRSNSIDIRLLSKDGHRARVKLAREDGPSLMLRVSRER